MSMKRFDRRERINSLPTNAAITGPLMLSSSCHLLMLRLAVVGVDATVTAAVVKLVDEMFSPSRLTLDKLSIFFFLAHTSLNRYT